MKRFKKMMAIAIVAVMTLMYAVPFSFAAVSQTNAPTKGSITINSPVVGATYNAYKIFDMTTNEGVDSFSYTIDTESPFFNAVEAYSKATKQVTVEEEGGQVEKTVSKGLVLSAIESETVKDENNKITYAKYNVSVTDDFDAQDFGKAMQAALAGSPAVEDDPGTTDVDESKPGVPPITTSINPITVTTETVNNSDKIVFENLPLGYFLINPTYPSTTPSSVTLGEGESAKTFTDEDFKKENGKVKEPRELTDAAKEKIETYVNTTVDDTYVNNYITKHGITTDKDGKPLTQAGKNEYKADLIKALKADAEKKILSAFNNNASEADLNVKEPILVFLDSSQPEAVINEKNEIDKWDIPVNPEGEVKPGTPEHGTPEGGKNIVVGETVDGLPIYGDWSEAEIGESVHYQLRVNAMNFINKDLTDDGKDNPTVNQVKEYFLADFQSGHMHFDKEKGLKVSIWQGDDKNNSQEGETDTESQVNAKINVTKEFEYNEDGSLKFENNLPVVKTSTTELDYTDDAEATPLPNKFFKNGSKVDAASAPTDVFGTNGTGIMVPWVFVVDNPTADQLAALKAKYPIYTITNVPVEGDGAYTIEQPKRDDEGRLVPYKVAGENGGWKVVDGQYISENGHVVDKDGHLLDADGNPIGNTKPVYTFSIYNSDVTIVVDYWMILDDDAVVDDPGNKNYAQYGWNAVDNKNEDGTPKTPTNPDDDEDKPSQKEEVDQATLYTNALSWVKIDDQGNELVGAEFELPFYLKKKDGKLVTDGDAYVFLVSKKAIEDAKAALKEAREADPANPEAVAAAQAEVTRLEALAAQGSDKVETTDDSAVITIKGVETGTYTITESRAPKGFNKLTEPFTLEAKRTGPEVITTTKTTVYFDAQGKITDTVTNVSKEYVTHEDSYNRQGAEGEETSVPVYQFKHIVNHQGTELPSTGGIGTTLFYLIGGILIIGAGVLLVTRRRVNEE